jgi:hypothetical protein
VLSVVVPQVDVTIKLDGSATEVARLTRTEADISAAVATASALGNARAIRRDYSVLVADLQSANNLLQTARSALLSAVPLSYPAAIQIFSSATTSVSSVHADISAARADIEAIAQLLRKRLGVTTLTLP